MAFAVTALSLLLATGGYLVGTRADAEPAEASPEAGFARDMMAHHAQAVEMAEIVRKRTSDPEVLTLATDIALTQQAQIGRTQGWLDSWNLPTTGLSDPMVWMEHPVDSSSMMLGMANSEDVAALSTLPRDRMDVRFLQLMIPHHQAAIVMAEAILERSDEPSVRSFALSIVTSQQGEIAAMRAMLAARGSKESEPPQVTMPGDSTTSPSASHSGSHTP